jgi:putative tryptophan/tyrosine transport system substrate-binding protein
MKRREFITLLGGAAAAWPRAVRAQQAERVRRIGMLETTSLPLNAANFEAFRQALRELGHIEGRNLVIEYRSAEGRPERFPELAKELVRLNCDLIVTRGTPAALAAKQASETIPIVMTSTGDPFTLVSSIAHPAANITGLSSLSTELYSKRLELLKEMIPVLARVAHLINMGNPVSVRNRREVETAARSLAIASLLLDVRKPEDIGPAFDAASNQRVDALIVALDTVTQTNRQFIALLAARHRLPAIYTSRDFVEAGGLMTYGVSFPDLYRRAAIYVDKIFKGAKPAELPIEQPMKFDFVINLRAAKAIGLTIPESFLLRADEVIE